MPQTSLAGIEQALAPLGYVLESEQPHISGERFLHSPTKMVLLGRDAEGRHVVIKVSAHPVGVAQLEQEKKVRDFISTIPFAQETLLLPVEVFFGRAGEYTVFVTEYIVQEKIFVAYPLEEQFFLALRAFESQEAFHATTYEHVRRIRTVFNDVSAEEYIRRLKAWGVSKRAEDFLEQHQTVLERYAHYLTHTDFVPHNIRVHDRAIYILDQTAIEFANKYEGWARFMNYMIVHNPALERLLVQYVKDNRGEDEYLALRMMRVYKAAFLVRFYRESLSKTEGDLHLLTQTRVHFWERVLECLLEDVEIPAALLESYMEKRQTLRSEEEKKRQREFAVA